MKKGVLVAKKDECKNAKERHKVFIEEL